MRTFTLLVSFLLISGLLYANSDLAVTKAYGLYRQERYEEALKICNAVIEKEKDNQDALFIAGISHLAQKNYIEAEKYFQRFASINPYNYDVIKYLAITKYYNQDYKGSIQYFEKIPKYLDDPIVLVYLALNYNRLNDRENLSLILKKIEQNNNIQHKDKQEFIKIIGMANDGNIDGTLSELRLFRDKYNNPFVITTKISSIESKKEKGVEDRFRLFLSINEAFDTNVVLYPDNDAVKLPDVKYKERYDYRTEARYSIGYRFVNTAEHILSVIYTGYQGINSNLYQYNFNSNDLELLYRFKRPLFSINLNYNYSYDFVSDNYKAYSFGHRLTPEILYQKGDFTAGAGIPVHLRHYFERPYSEDYNRSSLLLNPYLFLSYSFSPAFMIYNKDYFGINNAEGDGWKYTKPEVRLGLNYKYGKSIILNLSGAFGYFMFSEKISNPDYMFDKGSEARRDLRISAETTIDFRIYSERLYLSLGYFVVFNDSNVKSKVFDYSRHIASAGLKFIY